MGKLAIICYSLKRFFSLKETFQKDDFVQSTSKVPRLLLKQYLMIIITRRSLQEKSLEVFLLKCPSFRTFKTLIKNITGICVDKKLRRSDENEPDTIELAKARKDIQEYNRPLGDRDPHINAVTVNVILLWLVLPLACTCAVMAILMLVFRNGTGSDGSRSRERGPPPRRHHSYSS